MFPFVQFQRWPWMIHGVLMACLVLSNVAPNIASDVTPENSAPTATTTTTASNPSPATDLDYLEGMEDHLRAKALKVLTRFSSSESCTVDLNLELDAAQMTTTTYQPGTRVLLGRQEKREGENYILSENWEPTGTWTESTDARPRIKSMRVCVTLPQGGEIDHDHLYRCLSYELGIDLHRGDLLQIVRK